MKYAAGLLLLTLTAQAQPDSEVIHPSDQNNDGLVKLCTNASVSDCDYVQMYPTGSPDAKVQLPIKARFSIPFRVLHVYRGDEKSTFNYATDFYLDSPTHGLKSLEHNQLYNYVQFWTDEEQNISHIEVDIPRDATSFGRISEFPLNTQMHWYLNILVQVEFFHRPGRVLDIALEAGTQGPYSFFLPNENSPVQIIAQ